MVVLRMRGNGEVQERNKDKNQKASLSKVEQMGPKKWVVNSNTCSNMLLCLKGLALDPCEPETLKDLVRKLRNQTLKLRKVWRSNDGECSQIKYCNELCVLWHQLITDEMRKLPEMKKRKREQFLQRGNFTKASGLASQDSNNQNVKTLCCKQLGPASGLPNLAVRNSCSSGSVLTFDSTFQWKQPSTESNNLDNRTNWSPYNNNVSCLVDTEESINGSNPLSLENFIVQDPTSEDSCELIINSNSSSSEEKLQQEVRSLITESEGENLPRAVIPIGPGFQAEMPEWKGPINRKYLYDSESLKWLGTKMWPLEGKTRLRNSSKVIGRGRPDSCSCDSPGSKDCIKCHVLSARHDLQSSLGPAFLSWKFDEMGEVVSKAWTLREQHMFESFVKNNPLSDGAGFWEAISKLFPSKCKRSILNYYYNVFIPRRMREQTSSSFDQVDSDEDQIDDDDDKGLCWRRYKAKHDI
ncbi:hypothetical protein Pint_35229 [Pistacia integerrima]|uniref:Uncharacterized protein n=1 Tax=Pistacia integerrima TaxID=434235 RepID=A0ACC0Y2N9_9ROSI|nr:hypothetical protein Pint_35229 [Pistacia integerrima]